MKKLLLISVVSLLFAPQVFANTKTCNFYQGSNLMKVAEVNSDQPCPDKLATESRKFVTSVEGIVYQYKGQSKVGDFCIYAMGKVTVCKDEKRNNEPSKSCYIYQDGVLKNPNTPSVLNENEWPNKLTDGSELVTTIKGSKDSYIYAPVAGSILICKDKKPEGYGL